MSALFALLALGQEMNADETFRKIEETIRKAGTVAVRFSCESARRGDEKKVSASGELLLKEGNKCSYRFHKKVPGEGEVSVSIVSDGTTTQTRVNGALTREAATRDVQNRRLSMFLARSGLFVYQLLPALFPGIRRGGPLETLEIVDAAHGKEEDSARTVRYDLKVPGQEGPAIRVTLFYEARTFKPLKRVVTIEDLTITETYESFVTDSDLPDEKFALPREE
jgi:outer membrane lipoprotein-sorting protein